MSRGLALNEFLGHSTRAGSGTQYLKGWRKRQPPQVDTVLALQAQIIALWQHSIPRIYEKEDQAHRVQRYVYAGTFNCLEAEEVLTKQYRRDRDTGDREVPPRLCPVCLLLEALRSLYEEGVLSFTEPLFRWEGDDPTKVQVLTLGGMLNLYGSDRLTEEQVEEMTEAGVRPSEAWKESAWSKCNYVFSVVDCSEPQKGIQVAIETTALGDAVKGVIRDRMTSAGERKGNPLLTPYAIRWLHRPNEAEFNKKYHAIPMEQIEITDEIRAQIEADPPDIDRLVQPGNVSTLRAELERRCLLEDPSVIPWDEIFGPAERAGYGTPAEGGGAEPEPEPEPEPAKPKSKAKGKSKAKPKAAPKPKPAPAVEEAPAPAPAAEEAPAKPATTRKRKAKPKPAAKPQIPCDNCGAMMDEDVRICSACGTEYEFEGEAEAPPPPPPKPATRPKAAPKAAPPPAVDEDDDIPF